MEVRININLDAESKSLERFIVGRINVILDAESDPLKRFSFGGGSDPLQRFRSGVMSVWLVIGDFS